MYVNIVYFNNGQLFAYNNQYVLILYYYVIIISINKYLSTKNESLTRTQIDDNLIITMKAIYSRVKWETQEELVSLPLAVVKKHPI